MTGTETAKDIKQSRGKELADLITKYRNATEQIEAWAEERDSIAVQIAAFKCPLKIGDRFNTDPVIIDKVHERGFIRYLPGGEYEVTDIIATGFYWQEDKVPSWKIAAKRVLKTGKLSDRVFEVLPGDPFRKIGA